MEKDASQSPASPRPRVASVVILFNRPDDDTTGSLSLEEEDLRLLRRSLEEGGYTCTNVNIEDDVDRVHDAAVVLQPTIFLNLVEHMFGDSTQASAVMAMLDLFGYVYTGADPTTLVNVQDRALMHVILQEAGLPVTPYVIVRDINAMGGLAEVPTPHIVTQAFDDIYDEADERPLLEDEVETRSQCEMLSTEFDMPFLIEQFLPGKRVQACVLGGRILEVLPLTERVQDENECIVQLAQLDSDTAGRIRDLAQRAFRAAGLRDLGQIDFALTAEGEACVVDVRAQIDLLGPTFRRAAEQSDLGLEGSLLRVVRLCHERLPPADLALHPVLS